MYVVVHQYVSVDLQSMPYGSAAKHRQKHFAILIRTEDLDPIIPALDHVVGESSDPQSMSSRHVPVRCTFRVTRPIGAFKEVFRRRRDKSCKEMGRLGRRLLQFLRR